MSKKSNYGVRKCKEESSAIGLSHSCLSLFLFPLSCLSKHCLLHLLCILGKTGMTLDSEEDRTDEHLYDKESRLPSKQLEFHKTIAMMSSSSKWEQLPHIDLRLSLGAGAINHLSGTRSPSFSSCSDTDFSGATVQKHNRER